MTDAALTQHAVERMSQRAIRETDLELIMLIGTEVEGGYLVRSKDCQAAERQLKQLLARVRRLDGKRIVVAGGRVITAYRARPAKERDLLRTTEERTFTGG
jgi:hypothetical protein